MKTGEDEIVLADVFRFLGYSWKFIGLLTLALSALAAGLVLLLLPDQYSKQATLGIRLVKTDLQVEVDQVLQLDAKQAGDLAVGYIQSANLGEMQASPRYNNLTGWVEVTVQSDNRAAVEDPAPLLVDVLETAFRKSYETRLGGVLRTQIARSKREVKNGKEGLSQLDRRIEESPPASVDGVENVAAVARIQALETKRVDAVSELVADENRLEDMQEALRDLPRRADEPIVVEVLADSGAPRERSLAPVVALAVLSSFVVAVAGAILRVAVREAKQADTGRS